MSEWTRVAQPVRCKVELDKPLTFRRERGVLAQGDVNANAIIAEVYLTDGLPYDLMGCTALLTFVRPDNLALPPITADVSGNTAIATLTDACYEVSGTYVATMQLRKGGDERTVLWLIGDVKGKDIDGIVDPNHEIISLEDLMATAAEAQKAANAANTAAQRANAGAERAEQLQIDASGLAGDSNNFGGKPPEHYLPAVNLLHNSDWRVKGNIINQRGKDTYSGSGYRIDRWFSYIESAAATVNDGYITLTGANFIQILPKNSLKNNTYYTFAFKKKDGGITTNTQLFPMAEVSGYSGAYMSLMSNNGDAVGITTDGDFEWAALYEGTYTAETLPPFVPRPYAVELAECEYYAKVIEVPQNSRLGIIRVGYSSGIMTLPVPTMRKNAVPTIAVRSGNISDLAIENAKIYATGISVYGPIVGNAANVAIEFGTTAPTVNTLDSVRYDGTETLKLLVSLDL